MKISKYYREGTEENDRIVRWGEGSASLPESYTPESH
jgi:hypothetical protein